MNAAFCSVCRTALTLRRPSFLSRLDRLLEAALPWKYILMQSVFLLILETIIASLSYVAYDNPARSWLNGFVIARDTEAEAHDTLREIVAKANKPAVEGFRDAVQQAGRGAAGFSPAAAEARTSRQGA